MSLSVPNSILSANRWRKARENLGAGKAELGSEAGWGESCCHIHHLLRNKDFSRGEPWRKEQILLENN